MKRKRNVDESAEENKIDSNSTFRFDVVADDQCETDFAAYQDIVPVLNSLCSLLEKSAGDLQIYGSAISHLSNLGFPNVYNRNEDFYDVIDRNAFPSFDVIVTNPPYSSDHIPRFLKFLFSCGKPWIVLFPHFVYVKEYYYEFAMNVAELPNTIDRNASHLHPTKKRGKCRSLPFFIIPPKSRRRYKFTNIGGRRTSPFQSFWFVSLTPSSWNGVAIDNWRKSKNEAVLATNLCQIPMYIMDSNDRRIRADRDKKKAKKRKDKRK